MAINLKILDLTNLREITRGNSETEKMLFEVFSDVFAKAIGNMQSGLDHGNNEIWREQAHFLQGSAGNIGAEKLAHLCHYAEKNYLAGSREKAGIMQNIKKEFKLLKETWRSA